ncbi:quinone oxidoreductase family protein [Actinospica robiniae]|uniref:quinone oxidoreductase family protein n=1 Tax=Actinospica robiniae TaxID=304901 RepID=UPI00041A7680|nr:zinc-binding dehydrogenase [Actinospica robiniae]
MRAAVVHQHGLAPELVEHPDPVPAPGRSLIRITAAAVNPIDVTISAGKHPLGRPALPHVPGIEGAGVVVESETLTPGARVRVQVPGGFVGGTLAELVLVPDAACLPVADGVEDDQAAALGAVGISALVALEDLAALRAGESVLVLGATGALGRVSVQLARALGAQTVLAVGRTAERLASLPPAADGGPDATILLDATDPQDLRRRLAEAGGPVDVVIDSLWGPYAMPALSGLAFRGRYVNLGQSAGAEAAVDSGLLRHQWISLTGLSGAAIPPDRARAAFAYLMKLAASGRLSLPTHVHKLDDVARAWQAQAVGSPGAKLIVRP